MQRGNGGIIGPRNAPSNTSASGLWELYEQQLAKGAS